MPTDRLTVLLQADFGAWGRDDVERVAAELGWRLAPPAERGPTPIEAEEPYRVAARPRESWDDRGWFGEYTSLNVRRDVPAEEHADAHRTALAEVTGVLGPPALIGGPGAWARWRLPATIVELSGAEPVRSAAYPRTRLTLRILPREASENDEHQDAEWGEDWTPAYSWRAVAPRGNPALRTLNGMMSYPRRPVADWDELERNLRETFATLVLDLPVLRGYARDVTWTIGPAGGDDFVQGYCSNRPDADPVATFETRKDWRRAEETGEREPGIRMPHPTAQDGLRIAGLAMAEIRSWGLSGPAELRCQAWTDEGYGLDEFGLGLPDQRT